MSTQIIKNRTQLEIILDLPFGFPINNLISLGPKKMSRTVSDRTQGNRRGCEADLDVRPTRYLMNSINADAEKVANNSKNPQKIFACDRARTDDLGINSPSL